MGHTRLNPYQVLDDDIAVLIETGTNSFQDIMSAIRPKLLPWCGQRPPHLLLDKRLQAMRKHGRIRYLGVMRGWSV